MMTGEHPLDALFAPRSVAVIGATDKQGSVGRTLMWNLISSPFGGTVYAINPKRRNVLGIKAYPDVASVPEQVDLAIIVTPAPSVPGLMAECADAGVKGVIIISAGFKEIGPDGIELERQILAEARRGRIRIVGPNCLGVMCPLTGLNATFASSMAKPGSVGFISQSGALCTAVLDWSFKEGVGFSAFVSIGSMVDVNWGDLIYYLGDDPRTKSIVIYMESVGDASSFLSAAREVSLTKPIIIMKAGASEAAAKAAASHTGALAGSDAVLNAAFRRTGVLRVNSIDDMFSMAEVLAKQPRPKGPNLTILTNAGGPGVLATDTLMAVGGTLAELTDETIAALNDVLPKHWSHSNPVDILGDAGPDRYATAIEIVSKDPNSDGLLVVLTPQAMTDPTRTAERLKQVELAPGKPILASWMGGADVAAGDHILSQSNIPTFAYPDTAAKIFQYMWRHSYSLQAIYETPVLVDSPGSPPKRDEVARIIQEARDGGYTTLPEAESKDILAAYGIPVVRTLFAADVDAAIAAADELGYPIVLKLYSKTITHKTDVGGVQLNLMKADAVREAFALIQKNVGEKVGAEHFHGVTVQPMVRTSGYELIIGSSIDSQFGPVLLFGTGGSLVEVFKDRALGLPPLNTTLARRMMEQTKIYTALKGVRGRGSVDMAKLEELMVRFSQLVVEQPWIKEIDINPLLVSEDQIIALDGRVLLHDADTPQSELSYPAIRPYPQEYVRPWTLKSGGEINIRPIRAEDEPLMVKFHEGLSDDTVYYRYLGLQTLRQRVQHDRLTRLCFIDYRRAIALVAEVGNGNGDHSIIGIGRLSKDNTQNEAEFAIVVSDSHQGEGLGTELVKRMLEVGEKEGLDRMYGTILAENRRMQNVCRKLGFKMHRPEGTSVVAEFVFEKK
jgi:acetyltransferase